MEQEHVIETAKKEKHKFHCWKPAGPVFSK